VLRPPLLFPIAWSSPAFFGASAVLMRSHNGTVYHRVFVVRAGAQQGKDGAPYATFGPAALSAVGIVPITKTLGKVTPGNTGAVPVYHRLDEPAVIRRRYADGTRPSWQPAPDQVPLVVAEFVRAHGVSLC
jgi:hypothetical protein